VEAASEAFAEKFEQPYLPSSLLSPISPTTDCSPPQNRPLIDLFELLLRELSPSCWLWRSPFLDKGRLLLSDWLEHRLQTLANDLWSSGSALAILRLCRLALAPGPPLVRPTREQGHRALSSVLVLPTWLSFLLGGGAASEGRDLVLRAFACETSNRQLGLDLTLSATYLLVK
jgi:hypothetical protein